MQADRIGGLLKGLVMPVASAIAGIGAAAVVITLSGRDVAAALIGLFDGAFVGRDNIELTILNAIPLVFSGLSVIIGFRAGMFNIGAEGQVMVGGIVATVLATKLTLGAVWTPAIALAGSALAGAAWAYPPAWLKARRGAHEVITTLMFSYIAFYLMTWVRRFPLADPSSTSETSISIPAAARLPTLDSVPLIGWAHTRLHAGLFLAVIAAIAGSLLLYRTVWGYEIRVVGSNRTAAASNGIDVARTTIIALCTAGAFAGLGGGVELLGLYDRLSTDSFVGLGYAGFFVALMAKNEPLAALPAAVLLGALSAGGLNMQFTANVPINVIELVEGLIILFLALPVPIMLSRNGQDRERAKADVAAR